MRQERSEAGGILEGVFQPPENPSGLFSFSTELPVPPAVDQQNSGKCWLYAACNLYRARMIRRFGLADFRFSVNYLSFYDLLEKADTFLTLMTELRGRDTEDRLLAFKLADPITDTGQWAFFTALVSRYGLVPEACMPDTQTSLNPWELIFVLSEMLREGARRLREETGESSTAASAVREEILRKVQDLLCRTLGTPPAMVNFAPAGCLTPREFARLAAPELLEDRYAVILNVPLPEMPFGCLYEVTAAGGPRGGRGPRYLNLPLEEFRLLIRRQLTAGTPVWFGCDSRWYVDRKQGILSEHLYEYERLGLFGTQDKGRNLKYRLTRFGHAMVLQGFQEQKGRITGWRIENSYGDKGGPGGLLYASDGWFDRFVYEAVIDKKYLNESQLAAWDSAPVYLDPWSPVGTLA